MLQMKKSPMMSGRRDIFVVESDFDGFVTGDEWTGGGDTTTPTVVADVPHGIIDVLTTAVDNEETWLHTTQECFAFGAAMNAHNFKPLCFEAQLYYTEVTGDTANIYVGFMNAMATIPFQDDGAGPKVDFSGFGFYRLDGGVVWNTIVDNLTDFAQLTQALTLANTRNLAGEKVDADEDVLYRFRAECKPVCLKSALIINMDFDFFINDIHVVHENCDMTIASYIAAGAGNMHFGVAVHSGDAQILHCYVDYLSAQQIRIGARV